MLSEISRWKFYRTRKKAMPIIQGDMKDQYALLRDYCEELKRSNIGSTDILESEMNTENEKAFERLYYCLVAWKNGFLTGCRPLIGLEDCFLKV